MKPTILTGLRANNDLTIGNYFGAMLPMIDMAKKRSGEYQINMFIPDLHSFTTPIDHSQLYDQIINNAKLFVAAGLPIDNDDIHLYRQSYIPAHSELTLILDCFTGFGEMSRMIQFKDKSGTQFLKEGLKTTQSHMRRHISEMQASNANYTLNDAIQSYELVLDALNELEAQSSDDSSVGLFNYPVLMAADILLYNAKYVPVGEDQTQHLEYTRDIAQRMNSKFGDIFTVPEAVSDQHEFFGKDQGLRIKDLVDPTKKMSKSDESGRGVIFLSDDPKVAYKKVMGATTDNLASINYDREKQPGISNLLEILSLLQGDSLQSVIDQYKGQTKYGDFKTVVATRVEKFLADFQQRLSEVDDNAVRNKLEQSERDLTPVANATLLRAQQAVGLRPRDS